MVTFIGYTSNSHFKQRKKAFSLFEMSYRIGSDDPLVTDLFINKLKKSATFEYSGNPFGYFAYILV